MHYLQMSALMVTSAKVERNFRVVRYHEMALRSNSGPNIGRQCEPHPDFFRIKANCKFYFKTFKVYNYMLIIL